MLPLDSPKWLELEHAYGSAADIPLLIKRLETTRASANGTSKPLDDCFGTLYHQETVYTASYAAVPHLARIGGAKPAIEKMWYVILIGSIEAGRHDKGAPPMPEFLEEGYFQALKIAAKMVLECLEEEWDEVDYRHLFGALVAVRGKARFADLLFNLDVYLDDPESYREQDDSWWDSL